MNRSRPLAWTRLGVGVMAALAGVALLAAACGGGTSDSDKTKTAAAGRPTSAATTAATSAATTAATSASGSGTATTGGTASAGGGEVKTGTTTLGVVLTNSAGLTLYTFDNDTTADKSSCNAGCTATWPPLTTTSSTPPTVATATGTFVIFSRDDGTKQIAYKGKPLYLFAADAAAGDTKGDGVGGIWHAAKP